MPSGALTETGQAALLDITPDIEGQMPKNVKRSRP
jgi:hypothetical protein